MAKVVDDTLTIAWLQTLRSSRPLFIWLFELLLLPLPLLFLVRYLAPTQVGPRLIAGSMVFNVGLTTVNSLTAALTVDRFTYRLKLIRSYPVHRLSYAAGMLLAGTGHAVVGAGLL